MGHDRPRWWLRALVAVAVALLLLSPLVIWREEVAALVTNPNQVAERIRAAGAAGPLVMIGLTVLQVVTAPVPGQPIQFIAGYLYGFWPGMLYTEIGLVLGSGIAIGLGRVAGRPLLSRILDSKSLRQVDRLAARRGLRFFFLVFLIPFLPDDLLCYAAGLTSLPVRSLLLVAAVGRIPTSAVGVWTGAHATSFGWREWAVLGIAMLAASLFMWRYAAGTQERVLEQLADQEEPGAAGRRTEPEETE